MATAVIDQPSAGATRRAERSLMGPDGDEVRAGLDALAGGLLALWASALTRGDAVELARVVAASRAVHQAQAALSSETVVPGSHDPRT